MDIGGTTVKLGLFTEKGELLEKWEIPTNTENQGAAILPDVAQAVEACLAREIQEEYFDFLGQFLADVCCVIDPEAVLLGGGVSKAGQPLLDGVRKYFLSYMFHTGQDIFFALAKLGNDAGIYGSFKLALDAFGR